MKRRDITLGEMQDECLRVNRKCEKCNKDICAACDLMVNADARFQEPCAWNLTDPPRFTEAQMEALQASYASGVTKISKTKYALHFVIPSIMSEIVVENIGLTEILEVGETLDLAELLGKDKE